MRLFLLLSVLFAATAPGPGLGDPKLLKGFDAWIKAYRAGRIDFRSREYRGFPRTKDLMPAGMLGRLSAQRELQALLDAVVALDSGEAAERVLVIAATGLDDFPYERGHAPALVRTMGEKALRGFTGTDAKDTILEAARGELSIRGDRSLKKGVQAAGLRALGSFGDAAFRATLEQQLGASEAFVRLAAADGLRFLGAPASAEALARALLREKDDAAIEGIVGALRHILGEHREEVDPHALRLAVDAAIGALGRASWRSDMALVGFLEKFRAAETVPALIDILERFVEHPEEVRSGKLSGLLRHRAHEVLVSLTGAFFPLDRPDRWREFWDKEKEGFAVVPPEDPSAQKANKGESGTVSTGFFGIPVRGTRVVFVVDLSGSMDFNMNIPTLAEGEIPDRLPTRLDAAKKELIRAVDGLPGEAKFNMITFAGEPEAESWKKDLVRASRSNKRRFVRHVEKLTADGGTNTWAGLREALKMKSLVYGARYETEVDELFLLSDGMPSVGEVVNAEEILRLVRETNRFSRVRINTVYIADQLNQRDQAMVARSGMKGEVFMKRLAEENGGTFVNK